MPIQSLTRHENGVNSIILHGDLLLSGAEDTEIKVTISTRHKFMWLYVAIFFNVRGSINGYWDTQVA